MGRRRYSDAEIIRAVRLAGGNRRAAAGSLGCQGSTLWRRLQHIDAARLPRRHCPGRPRKVLDDLPTMWRQYQDDPLNDQLRNRLATEYVPWMTEVVIAFCRNLPARISRDDFISAAYLELLGLIARYNPKRRVSFQVYARPRIEGAVLDQLRCSDHVQRVGRRLEQKREAAEIFLSQQTGRPPTDKELTDHLGWSGAKLALSRPAAMVSLEERATSPATDDPATLAELLQARQTAASQLRFFDRLTCGLNGCIKSILYHYWLHKNSLPEVAKMMGISVSEAGNRVREACEYIRRHNTREELEAFLAAERRAGR